MNAAGRLYTHGSSAHPDEQPLELSKDDLLALPAALDAFNGFYATYPHFVITHPGHNLIALGSLTLAVVGVIVWGRCRFVRRRRPQEA